MLTLVSWLLLTKHTHINRMYIVDENPFLFHGHRCWDKNYIKIWYLLGVRIIFLYLPDKIGCDTKNYPEIIIIILLTQNYTLQLLK